jgi:hypothetical protein
MSVSEIGAKPKLSYAIEALSLDKSNTGVFNGENVIVSESKISFPSTGAVVVL